MTKAPTPTEKSKKQRDNTKTPPKTSITQRLRTDLGQPVGVTIAIQLVWLNQFTESQPSHSPQQLCNRGHEQANNILQWAESRIYYSLEEIFWKTLKLRYQTGRTPIALMFNLKIYILEIVVSDYTAVVVPT